MAKRAKKAKKTVKKSVKKTAKKTVKKAAKPRPTPTYLPGESAVDIPVENVADILAMIEKHGHTATFKRKAKAAGLTLSVHPKTVNFVKDFLANTGDKMRGLAVGTRAINSGGTFDCTKRRGGG
jgi:hypothetical protein